VRKEEEGRMEVKREGECRSGAGKGVEERRVFSNVTPESIGSPTPKRLDMVAWPALCGKAGSTAGSQQVPTKSGGKEGMQMTQEPRARGDRKRGVQPQVRVPWSAGVAARKVGAKGMDGVEGNVRDAHKDDDVSLEKVVSFVRREKIMRPRIWDRHGTMENALACRAKCRIINIDELSKAMKAEKAAWGKGNKEEIIVGWGAVSVGKVDEVEDGKGELADWRVPVLSKTTCERAPHERVATGLSDVGEERSKTIADSGKIPRHGSRLDVEGHEHNVVTQCVHSVIIRKGMNVTESDEWLKVWVVGGTRDVKRKTKRARTFKPESFCSPGSTSRLAGRRRQA
jgi:hypothetical protein